MRRITFACLAVCSISVLGRADEVGRPPRDLSKLAIETPTERLVQQALPTKAPPPPAASSVNVSPSSRATLEVLKVQPGKVTWHTNLDEACRASKASGKPVLLFQLLGNLDEHFT